MANQVKKVGFTFVPVSSRSGGQGSHNATIAKAFKITQDKLFMGMQSVADEASRRTIDYIKSQKKHPDKSSGIKLEDVLKLEVNYGRKAVAFMNVTEMDTQVPYWRWINFGGQYGNRHFVPGGFGDGTERADPGSKGGTFTYSQSVNGGFWTKPGTVITGMNFVERAKVFMSHDKVARALKRYVKTIR